MGKPEDVPAALLDGGLKPETTGFVDGDWYYEEDAGAIRLGMRITAQLHKERSAYQKLAVYQTAFFGKLLTLDDVIMFTERDEFVYHEMLTHLPLATIEHPRDVLIIGGGDCGCLREVLHHPGIERAVLCDIDERVTRVCEQHFDWVGPTIADPRAELHFSDGVAFVEQAAGEFDLVIVDSTDPKGPGVGLFLAPFFEKVRRALKPGGVMVAQTESPHWDAPMVGAIYEQLGRVFSNVSTYAGAIPSYPSGYWTWAWASPDHSPEATFSKERAAAVEAGCLYYNSEIHRAAFVLPTFAQRALAGDDPFARFETDLTK